MSYLCKGLPRGAAIVAGTTEQDGFVLLTQKTGTMKTTDYSQKTSWCRFPTITKDVDTFYIYATEFILGSFAEGAPASMNLGSLTVDEPTGELEFVDLGADARVNLARGSVVTNAKAVPMPEDAAKIAAEFFGPDGRHGEDYTFYYNNIKANVAKRIATYMASR